MKLITIPCSDSDQGSAGLTDYATQLKSIGMVWRQPLLVELAETLIVDGCPVELIQAQVQWSFNATYEDLNVSLANFSNISRGLEDLSELWEKAVCGSTEGEDEIGPYGFPVYASACERTCVNPRAHFFACACACK